MAAKNPIVVVTLRLPTQVHALLMAAAERDNRSMNKMVHTLIVKHCMENSIGLEKSKSGGKPRTAST